VFSQLIERRVKTSYNVILKHNKLIRMSIFKLKIKRPAGFTIVEIILAIAIFSVIILVLFVAVHDVQKARRDAERKDYASRVLEALLEYNKNNRSRLPTCETPPNTNPAQCPEAATEAARFLTSYLPEGRDPSTAEEYRGTTTTLVTSGDCYGTAVSSRNSIYCWNDTSSFYIKHNLVPRIGQVIITATHVCTGGQAPASPTPYGSGSIVDQLDGSNEVTEAAVLIGVEKGGYYCVSNGTLRPL
jgi:prepilin-type N-terminal cleavage/methylation domain-containing protein